MSQKNAFRIILTVQVDLLETRVHSAHQPLTVIASVFLVASTIKKTDKQIRNNVNVVYTMVVGVRTKIRSDRFTKIYGENHATCGLASNMDNFAFTFECGDRIISTVPFSQRLFAAMCPHCVYFNWE